MSWKSSLPGGERGGPQLTLKMGGFGFNYRESDLGVRILTRDEEVGKETYLVLMGLKQNYLVGTLNGGWDKRK